MKNKIYLILSAIIITLSLLVRLYKMENRAPFDWDQNRDYKVVVEIAKGKATLIGPVAKGEGGFFLGPLYYYLVAPTYIAMKGSPSALPVTSIILDVLAIAAILILLRNTLGKKTTFMLATLWSFSWFAIEMSRISWNVALVPLWSVLILWLLTKGEKFSWRLAGLIGLVIGFTWHIHAALIPIGLALAIFSWKLWMRDWKNIGAFIVGYGIPLIPLILFDMRHAGINYRLLSQMFIAGSQVSFQLPELLTATMMRLGKNAQDTLLGISNYNLLLGYLMTVTAAFGYIFTKGIFRLSSLIIVLNVLAVLTLSEVGFPEYYFAACYIPTLLIIIMTASKLVMRKTGILVLLTVVLVYLNVKQYSFSETSFGLSRKMATAKLLVAQNSPLDIHLELAPGREGGVLEFYKLYGGTLDSKSKVKAVVTDKTSGPIILDGELTTDIGYFGGIRITKFVVQ